MTVSRSLGFVRGFADSCRRVSFGHACGRSVVRNGSGGGSGTENHNCLAWTRQFTAVTEE